MAYLRLKIYDDDEDFPPSFGFTIWSDDIWCKFDFIDDIDPKSWKQMAAAISENLEFGIVFTSHNGDTGIYTEKGQTTFRVCSSNGDEMSIKIQNKNCVQAFNELIENL